MITPTSTGTASNATLNRRTGNQPSAKRQKREPHSEGDVNLEVSQPQSHQAQAPIRLVDLPELVKERMIDLSFNQNEEDSYLVAETVRPWVSTFRFAREYLSNILPWYKRTTSAIQQQTKFWQQTGPDYLRYPRINISFLSPAKRTQTVTQAINKENPVDCGEDLRALLKSMKWLSPDDKSRVVSKVLQVGDSARDSFSLFWKLGEQMELLSTAQKTDLLSRAVDPSIAASNRRNALIALIAGMNTLEQVQRENTFKAFIATMQMPIEDSQDHRYLLEEMCKRGELLSPQQIGQLFQLMHTPDRWANLAAGLPYYNAEQRTQVLEGITNLEEGEMPAEKLAGQKLIADHLSLLSPQQQDLFVDDVIHFNYDLNNVMSILLEKHWQSVSSPNRNRLFHQAMIRFNSADPHIGVQEEVIPIYLGLVQNFESLNQDQRNQLMMKLSQMANHRPRVVIIEQLFGQLPLMTDPQKNQLLEMILSIPNDETVLDYDIDNHKPYYCQGNERKEELIRQLVKNFPSFQPDAQNRIVNSVWTMVDQAGQDEAGQRALKVGEVYSNLIQNFELLNQDQRTQLFTKVSQVTSPTAKDKLTGMLLGYLPLMTEPQKSQWLDMAFSLQGGEARHKLITAHLVDKFPLFQPVAQNRILDRVWAMFDRSPQAMSKNELYGILYSLANHSRLFSDEQKLKLMTQSIGMLDQAEMEKVIGVIAPLNP